MKTDFITWLMEELESRGWSNTELARRAGVVQSTVSMVISGQKNPGLSFCTNIAEALDYPPEHVLRLAGLLPPVPAAEGDLTLQEISDISKNLSPESRQHLLEIAQTFYVREHQTAYRTAPENNPPNLNNAAPATT